MKNIYTNEENNSELCCCEYIDQDNERSHILGCCCNCVEIDSCFDKLVTCESVPMNHMRLILNRIQDRMRVPWQSGAKQISLDAFLPVLILPSFLAIASYGLWQSIIVASLTLVILRTVYKISIRSDSCTKFFVMWTITSIICIWSIFEFLVQPLLEITVEENIAFNIMFILGIFSIHKIRLNAALANVNVNIKSDDREDVTIELLKESESDTCTTCRCNKSQRLFHCNICQVCVSKQEYHCIWFDCCIGKHNRNYFILFLILAIGALAFGSNLTLTTVCHNFVFYKTILLPNDCGDVYDQFELALCFVMGVYSLILTLVLLYFLLQQFWFISLGITGSEWRSHYAQFRYPICLTTRPYSHGIFKNWINFCCLRN